LITLGFDFDGLMTPFLSSSFNFFGPAFFFETAALTGLKSSSESPPPIDFLVFNFACFFFPLPPSAYFFEFHSLQSF